MGIQSLMFWWLLFLADLLQHHEMKKMEHRLNDGIYTYWWWVVLVTGFLMVDEWLMTAANDGFMIVMIDDL